MADAPQPDNSHIEDFLDRETWGRAVSAVYFSREPEALLRLLDLERVVPPKHLEAVRFLLKESLAGTLKRPKGKPPAVCYSEFQMALIRMYVWELQASRARHAAGEALPGEGVTDAAIEAVMQRAPLELGTCPSKRTLQSLFSGIAGRS
jgi:hypothetical protein